MIAPAVVSIALCLVAPADYVDTLERSRVVVAAQADARQSAADNAKQQREARGAQREAAERKAKAQRETSERGNRQDREVTPPPPTGSPRAYARSLVAAGQFGCLDSLWTRESNWRWNATNPSSGAYGIPQALPASKMASAGPDWRTNYRTQIDWGISYIKGRYGTPCAAWAHSERVGWY